MAIKERADALAALTAARGKRFVMTYVTSRRENLQTTIGPEVFSIAYEHLRRMKNPIGEIDFFVMTYGGDVTVPLPLQNLLREYAKRVNVLVPAECYSAGTMIALGGDEIVMTPLGQLSPIDPSVGHPLNPLGPHPQQLPNGMVGQPVVAIAVEQVFSYLSLATEKASLTDQEFRSRAFDQLAEKVHPIALGEIHRTHSLIRVLAKNLLHLHMSDETKVDAIVAALTENLFNHSYKIARSEAKSMLGLPVSDADLATEQAMMKLREVFVADACMDQPLNLDDEISKALQPSLPGMAPGPAGAPTPAAPTIAPSAPGAPAPAVAPPAGPATNVASTAVPAMPTGTTATFPLTLTQECGFITSPLGDSVFKIEHVVTQSGNPMMPYAARQRAGRWVSTWI